MNTREFNEKLRRRAKRAGVVVAPALAAKLETYFRLLSTWNEKINLTALNLRDPGDETFDRLLVEPLAAARHVPRGANRMIDIGTGGGSPALPMVLAVPELSLVMVESKTRKSVFLREALRALGLARAEVVTARFEELLARPDLHEAHDLVTIRAVRIESRLLLGVQAFLRPGGQLFLFRGSSTGDLSNLALPPLTWVAAHSLVDSLQSRLVVLEKRTRQM